MVTDAPLPLKDFRPFLTHILERADFASDFFCILARLPGHTGLYERKNEPGEQGRVDGPRRKAVRASYNIESGTENPLFRAQKIFAPGGTGRGGTGVSREGFCCGSSCWPKKPCSRSGLFAWSTMPLHVSGTTLRFSGQCSPALNRRPDIHAGQSRHGTLSRSTFRAIVIDCRIKPWFPPQLEPLPETVSGV